MLVGSLATRLTARNTWSSNAEFLCNVENGSSCRGRGTTAPIDCTRHITVGEVLPADFAAADVVIATSMPNRTAGAKLRGCTCGRLSRSGLRMVPSSRRAGTAPGPDLASAEHQVKWPDQTRTSKSSKPRRVLDLVEPVEAHFLDHAVGDHDQPRLRRCVVVEMLVDGERRHVDEIAALPFEFFRLVRPLPVESIEAVEIQVPVQVVARALDAEQYLLPHVAMLAGALAGFEELHIGLNAALPRVHPVMNEMLDQPVRRALPRHVFGADNIGQRLVHLAELLRGGNVVDAQSRCLLAHMGEIAFVEDFAHVGLTSPSAGGNSRGRALLRWVGRTRSSGTRGA